VVSITPEEFSKGGGFKGGEKEVRGGVIEDGLGLLKNLLNCKGGGKRGSNLFYFNLNRCMREEGSAIS
jgi:hypothetical protein